MLIHQQCLKLLVQLEQELKQLQLWSEQAPSNDQLNSVQPFAVDTLAFEQWLQFIFIPKMTILVNSQSQLPTSMAVYPMAEESFKQKNESFNALLTTINQIDQLIANQNSIRAQ